MECSDWHTNFMAIYSLKVEGDLEDRELELLTRKDFFPADDPKLLELVDSLLVKSFKKKPDTGKGCGCKVWNFQDTPPGIEDNEILHTGLTCDTIDEFECTARRLARRYSQLAGVKSSLLFFMNVRVTPSKGMGGTFLVMYILPYKPLEKYDRNLGNIQIISDGVARDCDNGFIYPYFNGFDLDEKKVKVINPGPAEGGIPDLLYLDPPKDTDQLLTQELYDAISERRNPDQYEAYFNCVPKVREMFGDESFVSGPDLIPENEVNHISRKYYQRCLDYHGKKPEIKMQTPDKTVKFSGRADVLGESFFFARKGDVKFVILRADLFVTKGGLNPAEFLDVKDLDEVIKEVTREEE